MEKCSSIVKKNEQLFYLNTGFCIYNSHKITYSNFIESMLKHLQHALQGYLTSWENVHTSETCFHL